jgi:hypothetical protein
MAEWSAGAPPLNAKFGAENRHAAEKFTDSSRVARQPPLDRACAIHPCSTGSLKIWSDFSTKFPVSGLNHPHAQPDVFWRLDG